MGSFVIKALRVIILIYAFLHFINFFLDISFIANLQADIGLVLLILAGANLKPNRFKLPLFLILMGVIILLLTGEFSIESVRSSLVQMSDVIGLLIIVPMIGWVLIQEPYIEETIRLAHRFLDSGQKFYYVSVSFTHILSSFLLFGVIALMHQILSTVLLQKSGEAWEYFKGTALLRGFGLSSLWIISLPSFVYAVEALNASLWKSIFQGFFVAVAGIIMAGMFYYFEEKRYKTDFTKEIRTVLNKSSHQEKKFQKVLEFIFLFITLFGTIFLLYGLLNIGLMILIPFVIIVWVSIYFLVKHKVKNMFFEMKNYYREGLSTQGYQFSVLISAGVVIFAINQSEIGKAMINGIYSLQAVLPFLNMLYFLPFIVIIPGFLGLGPLTVMVMVAGILENISLPYSPELIVLAVTSGSAISIMISPLVMPVIILSSINELSPIKNGFKFNYKYAIAFYLLVQVYIQLMVLG